MKKFLTAVSVAVVSLFGSLSTFAETKPFTIDCSLESESDLDGWLIQGDKLSRNEGSFFGVAAHTPDYIISSGGNPTSADVIFTPVKKLAAGEPCNLEFYFWAPGGSPAIFGYYASKVYVCTSQSLDSKVDDLGVLCSGSTTDWTQITRTFTPAEDGEYCFAVECVPYSDAMASRCGTVAFDSFIVEGTEVVEDGGDEPVVTPGEGGPFTLDCTLEDESDLEGWVVPETFSRNTGSYFGIGSQTPDYVIASTSGATTSDVIFTPVKKLAAGEACTFEFYVWAPGGTPANLFHYNATKVLVCSEQSVDAQVQDLGAILTATTSDWTKCTFTFTPETEGEYCFAIKPEPYTDAMATRCGTLAFDSFIIEGTEAGGEQGGNEEPDPVVTPGESKAFTLDCPLEDENDLEGWVVPETFSRNTGSYFGIGSQTPDYVIASTSGATTSDVIFTPVKRLAAGEACTFEFYVWAPGGTPANLFHYNATKVLVCSEQSVDAQVQDLGAILTATTSDWTKCTFTFTPETEGEYCFAIKPEPYTDAMATRCGTLAFDSFIIEGTEVVEQGGGEDPDPVVTPGEPKAFTLDCPLEDENDLEGWVVPETFSRNTGSYFGIGSQTPDYIIASASGATTSDVIFTPVKRLAAGEACTFEFYVWAPGGTPANLFHYNATKVLVCSEQSVDAQVQDLGAILTATTSDWTKCTFTFTPETEGEYCFAIKPEPYTDAMATRCGTLAFDSFIIEGTEVVEQGGNEDPDPVVTPGEPKAFTLDCPLEDENDLEGWVIPSAFSRNTGSYFGISAQSPDYILGSTGATSANVIFTPKKKLAAGEPCTFEFYVWAPGPSNNGNIFNYKDTKAYVCSDQSLETQVKDFGAILSTATTTDWTKCTLTFTPEEEGEYCFAIQPKPYSDGYVSMCGSIAFDSFIIEGTEVVEQGDGEDPDPVVTPGEPKAFTLDCPLEDENDLEGWLVEGGHLSRNVGSYFGISAHTPDYILAGSSATNSDVVFSPVKTLAAGEPCELEFYMWAPGGNPGTVFNYNNTKVLVCSDQSLDTKVKDLGTAITAVTTDWVKVTKTFTPDDAGKYCFAIQVQIPSNVPENMAYQCGVIAFDSFIIEGTELVEEGNEDPENPELKGTPFDKIYNFDNDEDFPGISVLPAGWTSTGLKPFRRNSAATLGLPTPPSGEMVVGVASATTRQDNNLFTELFCLEGGAEATFSFSYFAAAQPNAYDLGYGFKIYAAPAQNLDKAVLIGTIEDDYNREAKWMESEVYKFVPEADGRYCFVISPYNETGLNPGGAVAYDDIKVTGSEVELAPVEEPDEPVGNPTPFTINCPFESENDLDGWKIDGSGMTRNTGEYFGLGSNTPEYILAGNGVNSSSVIYSPLMTLVAGEPCTIEFYFNTPGGSNAIFNYGASSMNVCTEQSMSTKVVELGKLSTTGATTGWQKCEFTYTPTESGEYCFAIQVAPYSDQMAIQCGFVGFDSFVINGTTFGQGDEDPGDEDIELEPNEDHLTDCIDLPYIEDFNGDHYDGTSYLPIGWTTTGTVTWVTGSHKSVPAVEGEYYMVAPHNTDAERDDRAYTPYFNLEAGKTYTIDYHVYMQGNRWNDYDVLYLPTLSLTVGTEQEADFHKTLSKFSKECIEWEAQSVTFTPEKSGPYCFAFMLNGPVNSGYVFVDALKITAEGLIARVEPSFMIKGIYSLFDDSKTIGFADEPIAMVNTSKYAESYKWTVEGAEPETSTETHPSFTFPAEGEYTIVLEATNAKGTRKTQRKIDLQIIDKEDKTKNPLYHYNGNQDKLIATGSTPAFSTDPEGDFVTGYNHYYFDMAQRFDFSKSTPMYLHQLSLVVTNRRYRNMTEYLDDQRIRPFSLVVYGADENGELDENTVYGRIDSTIGEVLGSSGIYSFEGKDIVFPEPVKVEGTFYIAMHFDKGMEVEAQDANFGRSYISTQVFQHGHGQTTIYAKPFAKPAASLVELNKWCTVDKLDTRMKGLGAYWTLWANANNQSSSISAIDAEGNSVFAATFVGDNLNVSGTVAGENVEVYNLSGVRVASVAAEDGVTVLPVSLQSGVYVVKSGSKVTKVAR